MVPRSLRLFTLLTLVAALPAFSQSKQTARSMSARNRSQNAAADLAPLVDDQDRVTLSGNIAARVREGVDNGFADAGLPMKRMIMTLKLRPGADAELRRLVQEQHDPTSANYHRWLTPEEFGARFGQTDTQINAVVQWLQSHGLTVEEIGKGRTWINFSGTAALVEQAFGTQIHRIQVNGRMHHANVVDPSIPRGLAGIVGGIVSLHDFRRQPMHRSIRQVDPKELTPDFTSGSSHFVGPADFATIYNVNPLYNAGTNGSGQSVAIVGRTDIALADVQQFRTFFGLPANNPQFIHNGADPGNLGGGEEGEADLDVQWSGAVARNATIKFVISASTNTTDGVDLSAQYIVNNNVAPAMSTSFGSCESAMGSAERSFYNNLWSQAASQGITSFVSSGDAGAAGCNVGSDTTGSGAAVSGLCSTPFNVCVGGTQFNDTSNPGTYWSSTNNSTTQGSALSYIPEMVWNESGNVSGGSGLWSSGGGASAFYAKPSWQVAPGVPADSKRDVPDVSLTAAGHDGYIVVQGGSLFAVGGTSASSPSFAGLMALIVQKTGARQGNANTVFYPMAQAQFASGGVAAFHDTTSGNNSVPGVTGFSATSGYDRATGLGSVDANVLVTNWGSTGGGGGGPQQLLGNPGFENGSSNPAPWVPTAGVIDNSTGEAAHSGSWKAWLDGYGTTHTDSVYQDVSIPSTATSATLTFWLHIDSSETTTTAQNDKLQVQVRNTSNTVLSTLATYSNLNKASGYTQKSFDLTSFKGQTVRVYFLGTENSSRQTSFVIDDTALNVQ